jgi:hypothetical protein
MTATLMTLALTRLRGAGFVATAFVATAGTATDERGPDERGADEREAAFEAFAGCTAGTPAFTLRSLDEDSAARSDLRVAKSFEGVAV